MDKIVKGFLEDFQTQFDLLDKKDDEAFENFCIYCIITKKLGLCDNENVFNVSVGGGGDKGIDGFGVIVNDYLISTKEELLEVIENNGKIDVEFFFIQAKTSTSFDLGDVLKFYSGIDAIFNDYNDSFSEELQEKKQLVDEIYNKVVKLRSNPKISIYYITTGSWQQPQPIVVQQQAQESKLKETNLFSDISIEFIDARGLQSLYRNTRNKVRKEIVFDRKVTLPEIDGVQESYIGILPIFEYFKLITDDEGKIAKHVFYDNVRDYQGDDNKVNDQIRETLRSSNPSKFVVLNNGITIVAKNIDSTGNKYILEDYQIVNGCQTSHVIYNVINDMKSEEKSEISKVFVPLKIASVKGEEVTIEAIKSTNTQSPISEEQLASFSLFHKNLEDYYKSQPEDRRLYYERRAGQYADSTDIKKIKIVTVKMQMKAFVSMFLHKPDRAWGYSGSLYKENKSYLFLDAHGPEMYYASAFALYKIESLFRNQILDKSKSRYRYVMLMILRSQICGYAREIPNKKKDIEADCKKIVDALTASTSNETIKNALDVMDEFQAEITATKDIVKNRGFADRIKNYLSENYPRK